MLCTAIQTPLMSTSDSDDSSESDTKSLVQIIVDCKRKAMWEERIDARKRKKRHSTLASKHPGKLSRNNPHDNPHILSLGIGESFQNPVSTVSDISANDVENPQLFESRGLLSENEGLPSSDPRLISSKEDFPSENLAESLYPSGYQCDSIKNNSVVDDHKIIYTSASDEADDLISFRNLKHYLSAELPCSIEDSDVSSKQKNSFKPSYVFRDLLHGISNNEDEEILCANKIFQPSLPMNVISEDEHILRDIRKIFKSESKLSDSTCQAKSLSLLQAEDKEIFQNSADQRNENCFDWDTFCNKWEGIPFMSNSLSEGEDNELETIEEFEVSLPSTSTSTGTKRKKPFGCQTNKRCHISKNLETIAFPSKSSFIDEKLCSSRKLVHSFEKEMEMIVQPVSSNISKADTKSKLKKFFKNTKIKLLEEDEIPLFTKQVISLYSKNLPDGMNDSFVCNDSSGEYISDETDDSFEFNDSPEVNLSSRLNQSLVLNDYPEGKSFWDVLQESTASSDPDALREEATMSLLANQMYYEPISDDSDNAADDTEELTVVEKILLLIIHDSRAKMVSQEDENPPHSPD